MLLVFATQTGASSWSGGWEAMPQQQQQQHQTTTDKQISELGKACVAAGASLGRHLQLKQQCLKCICSWPTVWYARQSASSQAYGHTWVAELTTTTQN